MKGFNKLTHEAGTFNVEVGTIRQGIKRRAKNIMELTRQIVAEQLQHASPAVMGTARWNTSKRLAWCTRAVAAAALLNSSSLQQLISPRKYTIYQPTTGPDKEYSNFCLQVQKFKF